MVQLLPSKCEALSSQFKSQYCKKKKKERERKKEQNPRLQGRGDTVKRHGHSLSWCDCLCELRLVEIVTAFSIVESGFLHPSNSAIFDSKGLKFELGMVAHTCHRSTREAKAGGLQVQSQPWAIW
jgi:hypothetical protein